MREAARTRLGSALGAALIAGVAASGSGHGTWTEEPLIRNLGEAEHASASVTSPHDGTTRRISVRIDGAEVSNPSGDPAVSSDGRYVAFESDESNNLTGKHQLPGWGSSQIYVRDLHLGRTTLVSVSSNGRKGNSNSSAPSISGDGRFIAFTSDATNLVLNDENGVDDVFVHDRQESLTTRVSISDEGVEANGPSGYTRCSGVCGDGLEISDDGNSIAFASVADNLVPGDTNQHMDVFVHDRDTGRTSRVSVSSQGAEGDWRSFQPSVSGDGRFVVFESLAENLAPEQEASTPPPQLFLHDRQVGTTRLIYKPGPSAREMVEYGYNPVISADGRFVAFESEHDFIGDEDQDLDYDVFVFEVEKRTFERVSVPLAGGDSNGGSGSPLDLSSDGRFVIFSSSSSDLVENDRNDESDMFLRDRDGGRTIRVSIGNDGREHNDYFHAIDDGASVSDDGRVVTFVSPSSDLVQGDRNGIADVFVRTLDSPEAIEHWVALGDSFSSGEGAGTGPDGEGPDEKYFDAETLGAKPCHRSPYAYSRLLDLHRNLDEAVSDFRFQQDLNSAGYEVRHRACSGAKIEHLFRNSQTHNINGTPITMQEPQADYIRPTDDLITLTIGGNDAGFGKVARSCTLDPVCSEEVKGLAFDAVTSLNQPFKDRARTKKNPRYLPRVYQKLASRAPKARILVLGYPQPAAPPPDDEGVVYGAYAAGGIKRYCPVAPDDPADYIDQINWLRNFVADLNHAIKQAVEKARELERRAGRRPTMEFLGVGDAFAGDELCIGGTHEDMNGAVIDPSLGHNSFHPTVFGYVEIAGRVEDRLATAP